MSICSGDIGRPGRRLHPFPSRAAAAIIGLHDARHELMADHVLMGERDMADAFDAFRAI